MVNRKWWATNEDLELVRFGLIWKVYSLASKLGLSPRVPILGSCERCHPFTLGEAADLQSSDVGTCSPHSSSSP